jgi:poly(3-hydroxybutyrate) depolymerase
MLAAILLTFAAIPPAVASPPVIRPTSSFNSQSVLAGASATFTVTATGEAPLVYQWRRDGAELPGQTNKTLRIASTQPANEGGYDVIVSNASGSVTSYVSRLYAVPPTSTLTRTNHTSAAGLRLPYFYHLPTGYDPARGYPLILNFTGGGIDEMNLFSVLPAQFYVHTSYARQAADPSLVVYVTRRAGDGSWTPQYLEQTAALVDALMASFNVDTNRIYVVGSSQGAPAAWDLLRLRPGLFAAAALPAGWRGSAPAASIKDVPMRVWHAADDPTVNVSNSREFVQSLRQAGGHPIYTEFQTGGHAGGIGAGNMSPVIHDWLMAQRRGVAPVEHPRLTITTPISQERFGTSAATLDLAGSAETMGETVTRVSWDNLTTRAKGDALGTDSWSAAAVPLRGNATNVIVVVATTASGFPYNGGTTTFSDTLSVLSLSISVTFALQGSELTLTWTGGTGPYLIQRATDLGLADWQDWRANAVSPTLIDVQGAAGFYRTVEPEPAARTEENRACPFHPPPRGSHPRPLATHPSWFQFITRRTREMESERFPILSPQNCPVGHVKIPRGLGWLAGSRCK